MRKLHRFLPIIIAALVLTVPSRKAYASPEGEFLLSCTYGVLAGTLVGAASLAFVDRPGDNLQHVARGASIGLYLGIGLGVYTVYVLPGQIEKEEEERIEKETGGEEPQVRLKKSLPRFMVFPVLGEQGVDGAAAIWNIASF